MDDIFYQSDPRAIMRRLYFTCVDTLALQTYLQSSDMSTFTIKLSKNGGTPASATATTPVQIGATDQKGAFYLELATADIDTVGKHIIKISNTGGTKTMEPVYTGFEVKAATFGTAATGTLTTTAFTTSLTSAVNDFYQDLFVNFLTGSLAGQTKKIGNYNGSTKAITLAAGRAFTSAPANGDVFEILSR